MRLGIAADHGGFELKEQLKQKLKTLGHEVVDFGAFEYAPQDDYPDLVAPLARAVARGEVERGVAVCGSGVGACVAVSKVPGARPTLAATTLEGRIVPFSRAMTRKPIRMAKLITIRGERFFFSMFVILLWA